MKTYANLAELIRHIQSLKFVPESDSLEEANALEEFDFYRSVFSVAIEAIDSQIYDNLIPISFTICSIDKAAELAKSIGMHIVEGGSGTVYLDFGHEPVSEKEWLTD